MGASTATYGARLTDSAARVSATLGDLTSHQNAIYFVAKHQTDKSAAKIRVTGVIDNVSTGAVHADLDVLASDPAWRKGVYDATWEAEDGSAKLWSLPAKGGETLEILESLK